MGLLMGGGGNLHCSLNSRCKRQRICLVVRILSNGVEDPVGKGKRLCGGECSVS